MTEFDNVSDRDCLGHTPAQAAEFEAMCRDHDETVVKMFHNAILTAIEGAMSHGMTADEINLALGLAKIMTPPERNLGALLDALEPFKRTTLLHGREAENQVVLMPLYPHQMRAIQQYLGVTPAYYKPDHG